MPQFAPPGAPVVYDRQTGEIIERPAANRMITSTDELLAWQVRPEDAAAGPLRRRYLIDGLILAGKRHLLVAEGGAGKTYLCMDMALRLAAAAGQEPRPARKAEGSRGGKAGVSTFGYRWAGNH